MKKLKTLLEGFAWERTPGKPLPTMKDVAANHDINEAPIAKVTDGDPFPTMSKWWTYPKEKLMSFVYWAQRQLPPSDENDYEENWQKVKAHLTIKFPPPTNIDLDKVFMKGRTAPRFESKSTKLKDLLKR